MKYGLRLKAYLKKNLIKNQCMTINILVLLDSILIYPESPCSNKYYNIIRKYFLKKSIYAKDKEAELLGKYIDY